MRTAFPTLDAPSGRLARAGLAIVAGAALLTLSAKTQVPFWPVPLTLQTLCVLAYAVAFGPRLATAMFAAYLAAGALGWPVFAGTPEKGVGLAYMTGPTGGYLLGNLVACWVVGVLAAGRATPGRIAAMVAGVALIYALGVAWLALFVPAEKLLTVGVLPFLPGDALKIALVAAGAPAMTALVRRFSTSR